MSFTTLAFLAFIAAVVLAFNATSNRAWRTTVLTLANAAFIALLAPSLQALTPLFAFVAFGYGAALLARRVPHGLLVAALIVAIVTVFAVLKRYSVVAHHIALPFPYVEVGLSYILFRVIQLVVDGAAGDPEARLSALEYFNFTCNFLAFVSGPIQRSGEHLADRARRGRTVDGALVGRAFERVVRGYVKVAVLSAIFDYAYLNLTQALFPEPGTAFASHYPLHYAATVVAYTFYLYFNFSGYMDIVIGVGWLLGQELPENFNAPFLARNLIEFWSRWHITLSMWFRTYLFNPLMTLCARHVPARSWVWPYLGVVAFFVTFFVMGVWHGATGVFVIYGLVMGAGVSLNKLWQVFLTERLGKARYRTLAARPAYQALSRGATFAFFAIALTGLWISADRLRTLAQVLGVPGVALAFCVIWAAASAAAPLVDRVRAWRAAPADSIGPPGAGREGALVVQSFLLASQVFLILLVGSFFHKAPEFVYKAF